LHPEGESMRARQVAILLLSFAAISLLTRWLSLLVDVIDIDETAHMLGGQVLASGGNLYTDFVNNKPPLLYGYFALVQLVFGRQLFAIHLITALLVVPLTALALAAFYEYRRTGIVAALTFLLASVAFIGHDMLATNAEILMILPGAWALALLGRSPGETPSGRVFAAGALFAIAALVKYQAIAWAIAWAGVTLARGGSSGRWRSAVGQTAWLVAGMCVVAAGVCAWFAAGGAATAFLYWTLWRNAGYVANPQPIAEAAGRLLAYFAPFVLVTSPLWWGAIKGAAMRPPFEGPWLRWLLAASVVTVFLGFRLYPHYLIQLYVPLALASAPWIETLIARPLSPAGRRLAAWAAAMVIGFTIANAVLLLGPVHVYRERDPVYRAVAERLRRDACAPGPLFVWGWAPMVYYHSGLPPASRFVVLPQSGLTGYVSGNLASNRGEAPEGLVVPRHWDWLMQDLEEHDVTFIVDTAPANLYRWGRHPIARYPRLERFVVTRFEIAAVVQGVTIYRRRGCESS
jgi:hypothetical protein